MSKSRGMKIKCKVCAPNNYIYQYNSEIITFKGWKIIDDKNEDDPYYNYLPLLNNKEVNYNKIKSSVSIKNNKQHLTEAKLISTLEDKGIGRPSTYSSIVEKNKERVYIEKTNIKGIEKECIDFELIENEIETIVNKRTFNNENNKLVIKPLGILVYETLNKYFSDIFNYEYTENMECTLDKISKGDIEYKGSCNNFKSDIENLLKDYKKDKPKKKTYTIDENHEFMFGKHGPVIKCTINDEVSFKPCIKDINLEKLENNEYTLKELLEEKKENNLGNFKGVDIIVKNGRYGPYISYGEKNISLKSIDKDINRINIADVIDLIDGNPTTNIIRVIDEYTSIRIGKGNKSDYIMYKKPKMKKPEFINLKKFEGDYKTCDIQELINYVETNKKYK